eukprot:268298-Amphidinium_carterae.1
MSSGQFPPVPKVLLIRERCVEGAVIQPVNSHFCERWWGRFLNLHEYQSQKIFADFGVGVPKNLPAFSPEEAVQKASQCCERTKISS